MEDGNPNPPSFSSLPVTNKKHRGGWRAIKYIIGNETFEKLASMSLVVNITVYLKTKYNLGGVVLINIVSIWSGSSNITSIIGALLADTYIGRFWTLLSGSIISLVGLTLLTLTAGVPSLAPPHCAAPPDCVQPDKWQLTFLLIALTFTALGAGGIRPCNIAFGADQFDTSTQKGRTQLESFFNWWYFSFTMALIVAFTAVVYIQTNISWTLGFAIPTVCSVLSIITFITGYRTYVLVKPQGSIFVDLVKVMVAATRKSNLKPHNSSAKYHDVTDASSSILPRTDRFRCLEKAAVITEKDEIDDSGMAKNNWRLCSIQQVESLKMLLGMFPVWVSGIVFLMAMDQQSTIGMLQAIQSNNRIVGSFAIPPAWTGMFSMVALAAWVLIYEQAWIPLSKKLTGKNMRMKMKNRFIMGIIFSIICPLVAAAVEKKRREYSVTFISSMSILWFLPQYALSGLVEAFGAVALMEFLTMELPRSMRTAAGAVFFLSLSMASYLDSAFVNVVHRTTGRNGAEPWIGGADLNKGKLENFYYVSAGIGVVNLLVFFCFTHQFVTRSSGDLSDDHVLDKEKEAIRSIEVS